MESLPGLDVDPSAAGKQCGHLRFPAVRDSSAPAELRVPVCIIRRGEGPTVTFVGGLREGESIGPITLLRLASQLHSDHICGRVIILPNLGDLTDGFPGDSQGNASQQLAALCMQHLLSASALVVELGAGGTRLCYDATCAIALQGSSKQQSGAEAAMIAFGAPNSLRLNRLAGDNLLGSAVIDSGGQYLAARLGGGAAPDTTLFDLALSGCMNILVARGVLDAPFTLRATRMLRIPDQRYAIASPGQGMPALVRQIGREVYAGQPVAQLFDPEHADGQPQDIPSPVDGVLLAGFLGAFVSTGERLAILADEVAQ